MEHSESITMISCPLMCTSKVSRVFTDIYQSSSCCRTSNIIFIFYTLFICCATQNVIEDPQIQTSIGIFRGKRLVSVTGRPYFAFLGIPYATPPVGPLRFKKPLPHPGWRGVGTFRQYRPGCPQFDSRGTVYGQEDCLYMNVYVPYVDRRDTTGGLLPVMAYIHAESFENGDGSIYGPDKLMEKPVILVTFNYRLGILGFLSTEDESAAGNWGLYDQKMALDWIQLHIRSFSGDPARVTIFGQGAGAASVFFHITSPLSQGLFSRAIMQSGSGLCHWALEEKPLEYAQAVADSVGCSTANTKVMVDCLRTMPVEKLLWTQGKGKIFGEFPQRAAPVVEHVGVERIIPQEPRTSLSSFPLRKVPVIIGLNKDETSYFYPLISQHFYNSVGPDKERVLLSKFLEAATPFQGVQKDRVIRVISQRYFDHIDMNNATQFVASFINMTTDALYLSCIDETAKLLVASGYPVNFYYFEYKGENSMVNLLLNGHPTLLDTGVCHGDELFYLFNLEIDRMRKESFRDQRMTQRMTTLWSDFATFSYTPRFANYEFPNWEKFDPVSLRYYRIGETLYMDRSLRQSDAHFWTYHLPEYAGKNAASLPLREQAAEASLYRTLAWSMVALSTGLLIVVFLLLLVLYMQRRKQSFDANSIDNTSSRVSGHSEPPRS